MIVIIFYFSSIFLSKSPNPPKDRIIFIFSLTKGGGKERGPASMQRRSTAEMSLPDWRETKPVSLASFSPHPPHTWIQTHAQSGLISWISTSRLKMPGSRQGEAAWEDPKSA